MSIWGAYFDDSENAGHLAVGGVVASCDTWQSLSDQWRKALDGPGINWFHAREFWTATTLARFGGDAKARESFYIGLVELIVRHGVRPVAYAVPAGYIQPKSPKQVGPQPKGHRRAIKLRTKRLLEDNYCKGLAWGYNQAARLLESEPADARVRIVVSDQPGRNGFAGILYEMAKKYAAHRARLGEEITTRANPRTVTPLQVADLVAWETTRDRLGGVPRPTFMRLRRLGVFKLGQPPRMFDGWGPIDQETMLLLLRDLLSEMNGDDDED